jgi:acetyltransferase-like isoleucine patch superfamily enzyme
LADIEDSVRGSRIVIGRDSVVDSFVKIKPGGGSGDVIIGDGVYLNSGCVIYSGNGVVLGNHVLVGANCVFAPVNHEFKDRNRLIIDQRFQPSRGGIVVEDDVWIAAGCVILDGSVIRRGAVIGAGSLVNREVAEFSVNVGTPVRQVGQRG